MKSKIGSGVIDGGLRGRIHAGSYARERRSRKAIPDQFMHHAFHAIWRWAAAGIILLAGCAADPSARSFENGRAGPAVAPSHTPAAASAAWFDQLQTITATADARRAEFVKLGGLVAQRHLAGGLIGLVHNYESVGGELLGRSGNIVHIGFERPWKPATQRTAAEKANDLAIIGWERSPNPDEKSRLQDLKKLGVYIIGFGPREMAELADLVPLCDTFVEAGVGTNAGPIAISFANQVHAWQLMGETVSALTRAGHMPTIFKAYLYNDGREWGDRYLFKKQFHDDYTVAPIPAGDLARRYVQQVREHVARLRRRESVDIGRAAELITAERKAGRKTVVLTEGHSPWTYVGKGPDAAWAVGIDVHPELESQMATFEKEAPAGALVLRLGYFGFAEILRAQTELKQQRVIYLGSLDDRRPGYQAQANTGVMIDLGCAFGDAVLEVPHYPIKLFPVSGLMQVAAYGAIDVEVRAVR